MRWKEQHKPEVEMGVLCINKGKYLFIWGRGPRVESFSRREVENKISYIGNIFLHRSVFTNCVLRGLGAA